MIHVPLPTAARHSLRGAFLGLLAAGVLLAATGGPAFAQASRPARPPVPPPPVDFDLGLDTRVREKTLHNTIDFDYDESESLGELNTASDAHFFRVRHRLWAQLRFRAGWRLYSRFTTEWRKYMTPYLTPEKTEIIVDNLYLDLPNIPGLPLSARIGRQDLVRGEGFLLFEGGPRDGSRSIYHNAILLSLGGTPLGLPKTKLELMAIRNPAWDEYIVANGWTAQQRAAGAGRIVESDETALGLYVTHEGFEKHKLEGYYFHKEEELPEAANPSLTLHTVGARAAGSLPLAAEYAVEGALQFGRHNPQASADEQYDHRSFGGYAWLKRSFRFLLIRPAVRLGGVYLSGDDPGAPGDPDPTDQGWNPLFSRWPKWSELYIYSLIPESGRVAYWTNFSALTVAADLEVSSRVALTYAFYYMTAPQTHDPLRSPASFQSGYFGSGTERGINHQWKLSVDMNPSIRWHFLIERFVPGDFYLPQDDAYFVRWELMLIK
ncbi:MAG: alginate export family protein [Candidatus Eisenbacteria bacterium]